MALPRLAIVTGTHRFPESLTKTAERRTIEGPLGSIDVLDRGDVVLANRHGLDDRVPVHLVDHGANMTALTTECQAVIAVGSCGSLHEELQPGAVAVVNDVFAPWSTPTLFDDRHAESMPGFDAEWGNDVVGAWLESGQEPLVGPLTYVQSPGPRFETRAEVRFYATVGDVVGMTLASEMVLAREAGLSYMAVVMVDNMAAGIEADDITMEDFHAAVARHHKQLWSSVLGTVIAMGFQL
jgi:5'-methylthioadenosine phosphorylase